MAAFTAPYQSMYEVGLARLREGAARKRAMLANAAARRGISTSGVSLIPEQDVTREELRGEAELGADIAQQQEQERLGEWRFAQQKELYGMSLAEAARQRAAERRNRKAGIWSSLIGGGLGLVGNLLRRGDED